MWLTTKHASIYVRHRQGAKPCPANDGQRCRCEPSYRVRYTDKATGAKKWSRTFKSMDEARSFQVDARKATPEVKAQRDVGTLDQLFTRAMMEARAGRLLTSARKPYTGRTLPTYEAAYDLYVAASYGPRDVASLTAMDWQMFVDALSRQGLKRGTIEVAFSAVRMVYRWACAPTRRLLPTNETRGVEMPAKDETPRDRVATPDEARHLLAALGLDDALDFGLALYAGLRNKERMGLEWSDVLDHKTIRIRRVITKSDAGVRTLPVIGRLRPLLMRAWLAQGRPTSGPVIPPTPYQTRADRVDRVWSAAGLQRITPHECRHTFASYLIASGLNAKAVTVLMGHGSVQVTFDRYGHLFEGHEAEAALRLDGLLGVPEEALEAVAT